jgi:SAM-dependent methyltransferase
MNKQKLNNKTNLIDQNGSEGQIDCQVINFLPTTGDKLILDACSGGRYFWYNKKHPNTIYVDKRIEGKGHSEFRPNHQVKPDIRADFKNLPFKDETFWLVVFDPPHLFLGETSSVSKFYGRLIKDTWQDEIEQGFNECWRVLKNNGTLIFKWNEFDIKKSYVLEVIGREPLFGHCTNRSTENTHWFTFMKIPSN